MAQASTVTWLGLGLIAANCIWGNLGSQLKSVAITGATPSPSTSSTGTPGSTSTVIKPQPTNGTGTTNG